MRAKVQMINITPFESNYPVTAYIDIPKKCPICGTAYSSEPCSINYLSKSPKKAFAYALFFCPVCENCFFVSYSIFESGQGDLGHLIKMFPSSEEKTIFSKEISSFSPNFVKIYNQSEQAENQGLTEICGMGYRKALEFLIKDYSIYKHPDKKIEIESSALGKCISLYMDNEKLKTLATASSWLGNDETHYIRKHEKYDLNDLKRFIQATVAFINYEFSYAEAQNLMQIP